MSRKVSNFECEQVSSRIKLRLYPLCAFGSVWNEISLLFRWWSIWSRDWSNHSNTQLFGSFKGWHWSPINATLGNLVPNLVLCCRMLRKRSRPLASLLCTSSWGPQEETGQRHQDQAHSQLSEPWLGNYSGGSKFPCSNSEPTKSENFYVQFLNLVWFWSLGPLAILL